MTPVTGRASGLRRWLQPGLGIKRWLLVMFLGLLVLAVGGAQFLRQVTKDLEPGGTAQTVVDLITLQFLPFAVRGLLIGLLGIVLVVLGAWKAARALTQPLRPNEETPLADVLYQKRQLAKGPRIVAIGGGTGLSTLLRGLKEHSGNITAIVTVADDGGSSGALREELGIPPVGDIRACIAALADAEPLMSELLGYRFPGFQRGASGLVETEKGGLSGHAVGNLLLAALTALEHGDFEEGVRRMNHVLAVRGQVVPASATPINLVARTKAGETVRGQSTIMRTKDIDRVWIDPSEPRASADALKAIAEADIIVLGPGSLYTSVLPVLLIPAIRAAVAAAEGVRIYACNVAGQLGETEGYDLADHVEALIAHTQPAMIDLVLANDRFGNAEDDTAPWPNDAVEIRWPPAVDPVPHLATEAIASIADPHHHDSTRLAESILRTAEREGPALRRERMARIA
ncbi:MAG TPA: gluconeogenesis factor YvcK family protein [Candidatus Limnocylindrales bacterium]|nr:gluconeogenesis factor YvcK family protein [Candidatus Limnocylindrales bacterium]